MGILLYTEAAALTEIWCMRWLQARASADIVLTEPGLSTIVDAIVIARRIFRRISNFLNYRIAATLQLLLFFFIAVFAFAPHDYNPRVSHPCCLCCHQGMCLDSFIV